MTANPSIISTRTVRLAAALFIVLAPLSARAQSAEVWFGGGLGLGYADINCDRCGTLFDHDPWEGGLGLTGHLTVGRTFTPQFRVGAELNIWVRRDADLDRDATLATLGVGGRYYPNGDFFASLGVGIGQSFLAGGGLIESPGLALAAGIGYDIYISTHVAVTPFLRIVQIIGEGAEGSNQDEVAHGADHPRFAKIGLALFKY